MAKALSGRQVVREVFQVLPHVKRFPSHHIWMDYDEEADTLYVSFEKPQRATDSILQEDNVLLRYRGKKLVGITVIGSIRCAHRHFHRRPAARVPRLGRTKASRIKV